MCPEWPQSYTKRVPSLVAIYKREEFDWSLSYPTPVSGSTMDKSTFINSTSASAGPFFLGGGGGADRPVCASRNLSPPRHLPIVALKKKRQQRNASTYTYTGKTPRERRYILFVVFRTFVEAAHRQLILQLLDLRLLLP